VCVVKKGMLRNKFHSVHTYICCIYYLEPHFEGMVIKLLKTKTAPELYLKVDFVPHCKHTPPRL
jgi:hypothetical protein